MNETLEVIITLRSTRIDEEGKTIVRTYHYPNPPIACELIDSIQYQAETKPTPLGGTSEHILDLNPKKK